MRAREAPLQKTVSRSPSTQKPMLSLAEERALARWFAGSSAAAALAGVGGTVTEGRNGTTQTPKNRIRILHRRLLDLAHAQGRSDLAERLAVRAKKPGEATALAQREAIELLVLRGSRRDPLVTDAVGEWFDGATTRTLATHGVRTLADLTVRVPRRKCWWRAVEGLGPQRARRIEAFFASHEELSAKAHALVAPVIARGPLQPWETLEAPKRLDGSRGRLRGTSRQNTLGVKTDLEALQLFVAQRNSPATQRSYAQHLEKLVLWCLHVAGKPVSSLTVKDAQAFRAFLQRPTPAAVWVGPPRPRGAADWKPFGPKRSKRTMALTLRIVHAAYAWLVDKGYLLANPFAGLKVANYKAPLAIDLEHIFSESEWVHVRSFVDVLARDPAWSEGALWRLRFVLNFSYATGLRASELVDARVGDLADDAAGNWWLKIRSPIAGERAKVFVPLPAKQLLDLYVSFRGLGGSRRAAVQREPLVPALRGEGEGGPITTAALRAALRRFFEAVARHYEGEDETFAKRLRAASPHWLRHTHATHALRGGASLKMIRDNLRHASIATTAIYLHAMPTEQARGIGAALSSKLPSVEGLKVLVGRVSRASKRSGRASAELAATPKTSSRKG